MSDAAPQTLPEILAIGDADRAALVFPDVALTFGQLRSGADRWSGRLRAHKVGRGDFIGVLLPTCPDFVELMFGIAALGAVFVPINPRYRATELLHLINDAGLVGVITTDEVMEHVNFVSRLAEALPSARRDAQGNFICDEAPALRFVAVIGGDGRNGTTPVAQMPIAPPATTKLTPHDLAMVLYTSGTSAAPKGCLLTHAIVAGSAVNYANHYGVVAGDTFWVPLPIHHVAGIIPLLAIFSAGGSFLTLRHFDPGAALALIEEWRPTCGLPSYVTIVQDLMDHPRFAETDFSCFRWMNTSPSVQPEELREAWASAMPMVAQVGTYGMTEGVGPVTGHRIDDPADWCARGLGRPFPGWELRIVQLGGGGGECGDGEIGEVQVRGKTLAAGYHRREEPLADKEGWFRTGDLGVIENGQVVFRGRLKDMLKVGGENVAASEIEEVLNLHPSVRLAQVIGVAHPRYVEVPVAFVQLVEGAKGDTEELIAHCRKQLASFKTPRDIVFVDDWPMSTTKIQKFRLRDIYARQAVQAS